MIATSKQFLQMVEEWERVFFLDNLQEELDKNDIEYNGDDWD